MEKLGFMLQQAHSSLEANSNFDLEYEYVVGIISLFGVRWYRNREFNEEKSNLLGWQRRAWNAILCTEKVLYYWQQLRSAREVSGFEGIPSGLFDIDFIYMIASAKKSILSGNPYSFEFNYWEMGESNLSYILRNVSVESHFVRKFLLSYFTIKYCMGVVSGDEKCNMNSGARYSDMDKEDPISTPVAIHASKAFAGLIQFPIPREDDKYARKIFWHWWLKEAVPASWNLEELNSS